MHLSALILRVLMSYFESHVNFSVIDILWVRIQIQGYSDAITVVFFYLSFVSINFFNLSFL